MVVSVLVPCISGSVIRTGGQVIFLIKRKINDYTLAQSDALVGPFPVGIKLNVFPWLLGVEFSVSKSLSTHSH